MPSIKEENFNSESFASQKKREPGLTRRNNFVLSDSARATACIWVRVNLGCTNRGYEWITAKKKQKGQCRLEIGYETIFTVS